MFDYWILSNSCALSSSSSASDAVSKSEYVFVPLVLEGVGVHINEASAVGETSINQFFLGLAGWVNNSLEEVLLDDFA